MKMDEITQPQTEKTRAFIRFLLMSAAAWLALGVFYFSSSERDLLAFIQLFVFSFLDLIFLILIFWQLFFASSITSVGPKKRTPKKMLQIMVFVTFKLVCLGFLAITLKRLQNDSQLSMGVIPFGVGFIGFGPLVAGMATLRKKFEKVKNKKVN